MLYKNLSFVILFLIAISVVGCAVEASKTEAEKMPNKKQNSTSVKTIEIKPDSPADTVRVFYQKLREKKFREAIFLTNLRPAIEGLTDAELADFQVDFEYLAQVVPAELEINGEIISGNKAIVTANLPDGERREKKLQQINLRREDNVWVILTLEEEAEKAVKKEGKNYFFALRIQTHHEETQNTIEKIIQAQSIYAMQNGGKYADLPTLVQKNLISSDIQDSKLYGYKFNISLSTDAKNYSITAEPLEYGKTGILSFLAETKNGATPQVFGKDNGGKMLKN